MSETLKWAESRENERDLIKHQTIERLSTVNIYFRSYTEKDSVSPTNIGEAGSRLKVCRRGEYQSFVT